MQSFSNDWNMRIKDKKVNLYLHIIFSKSKILCRELYVQITNNLYSWFVEYKISRVSYSCTGWYYFFVHTVVSASAATNQNNNATVYVFTKPKNLKILFGKDFPSHGWVQVTKSFWNYKRCKLSIFMINEKCSVIQS